MKKPRVHVTDHAIVRHLERVLGLPIEDLRREIGRDIDGARERIEIGGEIGVVIGAHVYKLKGSVVTTVVSRCEQARGKGRR